MFPRNRERQAAAAMLVAGWLTFASGPECAFGQAGRIAQAQFGPAASGEDLGAPARSVFQSPRREILQQLKRARALLDREYYSDAVEYLDTILQENEDYFFRPDKSNPLVHRSLKAEALRLIGQMPPKGREIYERDHGFDAREMLREALERGDTASLAAVGRRFFHTRAGAEATLLLGLRYLDLDQPLAGALTLRRLDQARPESNRFEPTLSLALAVCWLRSGMPAEAEVALTALRQRSGTSTINIGGRQLDWFQAESEACEWLLSAIGPVPTRGPRETEHWVMFRGSPGRNATSDGSTPLMNLRWRIPATDDPTVEQLLRQVDHTVREQNVPMLPRAHPLVVHRPFQIEQPGRAAWKVDDVLLMRTLTNLLAVDLATGKRLWEVPADNPLEGVVPEPGLPGPQSPSAQQATLLAYRFWSDATFGTISSDGRLVFSVEGTPQPLDLDPNQAVRRVLGINHNHDQTTEGETNRLAAHDIRTGKLRWHIGGADDQFALPLAETFFLGPPLPLMGKAYVLAEKGEEVRLLALDAETGRLLWAQQLSVVESEFGMHEVRRNVGVCPSYADGVLVCPTATGAVVAVDLATRSLLWGYQYEERGDDLDQRTRLMQMRSGQLAEHDPSRQWADASVTIAEGRVLLTPTGSEELHCLDLISGEPLWRAPRGDDLYVACVRRGTVVLVGRREVHAVSLHDTSEKVETVNRYEVSPEGEPELKTADVRVRRPEPAWDGRAVELPAGAVPSGRGFFSGERYFLPLSTAEVVALDLDKGRLVGRAKSRKERVPGNLVCYQGKVISQNFEGVDTFYQLDSAREEIERRLAADEDDPVALSLRGEILLDEGRLSEAIALFRRAYRIEEDPRTRVLLRDALLDGLDSDFAAHRDRVDEIKALLDTPKDRARFLRLMAFGFQDQGEWSNALSGYLELLDQDRDGSVMDEVETGLLARRDRWIRAQLASLHTAAEAKGEDVLTHPARKRLETVLAQEGTKPLRRFLAVFADLPVASKARRQYVDRLRKDQRFLEAELTLWPETTADDPQRAAPALAELAELLVAAARPDDAARCYRRLDQEFGEVVCRDGKTGSELAAEFRNGAPSNFLAGPPAWPEGNVRAELLKPGQIDNFSYTRHNLPLRGGTDAFFGDMTIQLDQHRRVARGIDGYGRPVWEMALQPPGNQRNLTFHRTLSHARACGHLLLVTMGQLDDQVVAIDTLAGGDPTRPKHIWDHNLQEPGFDLLEAHRMAGQQGIGLGGPLGVIHSRLSGSGAGELGPVTASYVCFQKYRKLVAVDPIDGKPLWVRQNVAPESILFGDEQYVFALGTDSAEADVYRALDGAHLGRRTVPRSGLGLIETASNADDDSPRYQPFDEQCLATFGRRLLLMQQEAQQYSLQLYDPWTEENVWPPRRLPSETRYALIGREALALLEPDGRFRLISLPNGHAITDVTLDVDDGVAEIFAFRSGNQYILVTHTPTGTTHQAIMPVQAVPGMQFRPITRGQVFSFDRQGNSLWPEPARIENQHVLPMQPPRLPVVTFACQVYDRSQTGANQRQVSVLCLDKRTGRTVYENRFPGSTNVFDITGDPEEHTVEVKTARHMVRLTFTDDPIKPPEPASMSTALLRALEKAVERSATEPLEPPAPPPDELQIEMPR